MNTYLATFSSPLGLMLLEFQEQQILSASFIEKKPSSTSEALQQPLIQETLRQLSAYFEGKLQQFDLPLAIQGTEFQQRVWQQLNKIPYGKTETYLGMARHLGDEKVLRAAGTANGKNPIGIIIPCHRVIGSDGSLTGYAGGLWRKKWLLDHEAKHSGRPVQSELFTLQ